MSYIVVDVESDGPIIGKHSMICFGAVVFDDNLDKTFYGECKPESNSEFIPDALAISGFSREETLKFQNPQQTMEEFAKWLDTNSKGRPVLISDNNGYDASWINYYFHVYYGSNPFGWSSRRIGDLFCGYHDNMYYRWKKFRKTPHDHTPLNDCVANAEALLHLKNQGFNLKF